MVYCNKPWNSSHYYKYSFILSMGRWPIAFNLNYDEVLTTLLVRLLGWSLYQLWGGRCVSIFLSSSPAIYLSLSSNLSVYLSIYLSQAICLFICLSTSPKLSVCLFSAFPLYCRWYHGQMKTKKGLLTRELKKKKKI